MIMIIITIMIIIMIMIVVEAGADVEGWDVVRGPRKEGRWSRLTMVPPLVIYIYIYI